jgi:hypothetical protein
MTVNLILLKITARREKFQQENVEEIHDLEVQKLEDQVQNKMLKEEKQHQLQAKFEPKSFGRKKVAWN